MVPHNTKYSVGIYTKGLVQYTARTRYAYMYGYGYGYISRRSVCRSQSTRLGVLTSLRTRGVVTMKRCHGSLWRARSRFYALVPDRQHKNNWLTTASTRNAKGAHYTGVQ